VKKVIEERRRWSRDRNGVKFAEIGVEVVVVKEQMVRVCTLGGRPCGGQGADGEGVYPGGTAVRSCFKLADADVKVVLRSNLSSSRRNLKFLHWASLQGCRDWGWCRGHGLVSGVLGWGSGVSAAAASGFQACVRGFAEGVIWCQPTCN
jgi:hypothetical protein